MDDRDEIELKILGWLERPDAELEPIMDSVGLGDGSFGSSREDHRRPYFAFAQKEPYTATPTSEGAQKWQTLSR